MVALIERLARFYKLPLAPFNLETLPNSREDKVPVEVVEMIPVPRISTYMKLAAQDILQQEI